VVNDPHPRFRSISDISCEGSYASSPGSSQRLRFPWIMTDLNYGDRRAQITMVEADIDRVACA
jgi:hypothetical protein